MIDLGTKSNKKMAEKSVYLPWLICKLITTIEAWFFYCIGPYLSIVQNRLWYPFETCIFNRVGFVAESGSQIASYSLPILWISQTCPNRGYSQYITCFRTLLYYWLNAIDLGIDSHKLFLKFLFQLTRSGSPFSVSHLISLLIFHLCLILYFPPIH